MTTPATIGAPDLASIDWLFAEVFARPHWSVTLAISSVGGGDSTLSVTCRRVDGRLVHLVRVISDSPWQEIALATAACGRSMAAIDSKDPIA